MKKNITVVLLILTCLLLLGCNDTSDTTSESQSNTFNGPSGYFATLVCPEDASVDGTIVDVYWKKTFDFPTPKRENYKFVGWQCGDDKLNSLDIWPYVHDAELVATWAPITYTIDYTLSPVLGNAYSNYNVETEEFYLPIPKLVKDYIFLGWTGEGLETPTKSVLISKGSFGNRKYTANWQSSDEIVHKNENGFAFEIIDDYAIIVGYFGEARESLYLPSEYNGYPVRVLGEGALYGINKNFQSLHIPYTLNVFEDYALGSGWAIYIEDGEPSEWLDNSTFGKGNGTFSEQENPSKE